MEFHPPLQRIITCYYYPMSLGLRLWVNVFSGFRDLYQATSMTTLTLETEPLAAQVRVTDEKLIVDLVDGRGLTRHSAG